MPRFAANLSMMFTEVPFLDRFDTAAKAGFTAVEFLFPYEFPAAELQRRALHVLSGLRDDVDHPVEGIEAVNNRGGSFQYLDAFNLRKGDRKRFPEHEALAVDVDRATVHHHENFVGEELIVASCADIEVRTGDLHDIQPGYAAENSGNVGRARVPNTNPISPPCGAPARIRSRIAL